MSEALRECSVINRQAEGLVELATTSNAKLERIDAELQSQLEVRTPQIEDERWFKR